MNEQPGSLRDHTTTPNRLVQYQLLQDWYDLVMARQEGNDQREYVLLVKIAATYTQQHLYSRAIDVFEQALVVVRRTHNKKSEGGILCTIGDVYTAWGRTYPAIQQYERALVIAHQLRDARLEHACLTGLKKVENALIQHRLQAWRDTAPRAAVPHVRPPRRPVIAWDWDQFQRRTFLLLLFMTLVGIPLALAELRAPLPVFVAGLALSGGTLLVVFEKTR